MSVGILTGAGASKPLGLPVMAEMFDSTFRREVTEEGIERALYDIAANWAAADSDDESIDFELLYTAVAAFSEMDQSDLEALPFAPHRGGPGLYYLDGTGGKMKLGPKKTRRAAESLKKKLQARVHDLMGGVDAEEAAELYLPLFEAVDHSRPAVTLSEVSTGEIQLFTTNYDRAIEAPFWENRVELSGSDLQLVDGMAAQDAGPRAFEEDQYDRSPATGEVLLKLYKLHGSLNWQRQGDRILESPGDEFVERNAVIYPIRDPKDSLRAPFSALLKRFETALREKMDTLLVIGSSFRDEHIRKAVVEAVKGDASLKCLIVLDPRAEKIAESLQVEGVREGEIVSVPERFGDEGTMEKLGKAFETSGRILATQE